MHHEPHMDDHTAQRGDAPHDEHHHPGTWTYIAVAAILTVLTLAEVAVFYIDALRPMIVPILAVLTTGKFVLVVMFYMHLKMDSRIFTWVFVAPMSLAIMLVVGLILLFRIVPNLG